VLDFASEQDRFKAGRVGDHLMTHFQCDLCHFRNVQGWDPSPGSLKDNMILLCIRRVNLDALWSRESSTVYQNWREANKFMTKANKLGLNVGRNLPKMGPFAVKDEVGMFVAINLAMRTLDPGVSDATVQYSTARKFRSFFSNLWSVSAEGAQQDTIAVRDTIKMSITSSPTNKDWFERCLIGMHLRMGDTHHPDLGISIEVMLELMARFERDWRAVSVIPGGWVEQSKVIFPALFSIVAFCGALRGEEVPLADLTGMRTHHYEGARNLKAPHTLVALLGRFKTESGEKYHLMPLALETCSGLRPGDWVERMLNWYSLRRVASGPVFRNRWGDRAKAMDFHSAIFAKLLEIQMDLPDLISPNINVLEEYGMARSFRRGSDTQAINRNVSKEDIELNCRWRSIENAKGRTPRLRMMHHYAEVKQALVALLRYSQAL
jgi:hypothetical protein